MKFYSADGHSGVVSHPSPAILYYGMKRLKSLRVCDFINRVNQEKEKNASGMPDLVTINSYVCRVFHGMWGN